MMLKATQETERERLDGLEAAESRRRFACLARCDFSGARSSWQQIKSIRRKKAALITGELFPDTDDES